MYHDIINNIIRSHSISNYDTASPPRSPTPPASSSAASPESSKQGDPNPNIQKFPKKKTMLQT